MTGSLVVVATPLGNLGDLTPRALDVLKSASVICCEDTRRTRKLLSAFDVRSSDRLVALHEHNEASLCASVVERVQRGEMVAVVSDAGTPTISDPGGRVVAAVAAAGLTVTTTPGPSAVIAALSVSGLATERFIMEGFLPRAAGARRKRITEWRHDVRTVVLYESPQRVAATMREMFDILGDREVVMVREISKLHEEIRRGTLSGLASALEGTESRGEIVVVLAGSAPAPPASEEALRDAVRELLSEGSSVRDASNAVAEQFGAARRDVYKIALSLRETH